MSTNHAYIRIGDELKQAMPRTKRISFKKLSGASFSSTCCIWNICTGSDFILNKA